MCDRNKQEVLARELCILYWQAQNAEYSHLQKEPLRDYVETRWPNFIARADELLDMIGKHDD